MSTRSLTPPFWRRSRPLYSGDTYDLLSCDRDFFSACWWNLMFFTILALKSSNPLEGKEKERVVIALISKVTWRVGTIGIFCHIWKPVLENVLTHFVSWLTAISLSCIIAHWRHADCKLPKSRRAHCAFLPWGLFGRSLQLCGHVQEVETEEDPPLQQQAEKADTVPHDAGLLHRKAAGLIAHRFRCRETETFSEAY